ncbi:ATP-dependent helicase [Natronomonas halophila]|uniref:UvrD-helicase domain-containing protein n=1 Tax=Natronomonas halophila TaxID=2747817 RepID=UPI0015B702AE|nr:ATP-dependent DNA helicase [Natronomonas halophila]QLD87152.1 ATP-dependent helicase [Natronomonas halophila]
MTDDTTPSDDPSPNPAQQRLIDSTDGLYLVDAGAGTGKTFTITRRYANIVDSAGVDPDDILLLTFTNNAAGEMKDRIVAYSDYGASAFADAPIGTFHSLCHRILEAYGTDAPTHLGIDDRITGSTRVVDDDVVEAELFREFRSAFSDRHPEHHDLLRVATDDGTLLDLINNLAARGVFPTADGWYRDGREKLEGDREAFREAFDDVNEPRNGGSKQSRLRKKLNGYGKSSTYLPEAPAKADLRGERGTKAVPETTGDRAYEEDREELFSFVHDLYFEYLEFALARNYLTFGFLQLFAFVLLCEDASVREELAFEYTMIDEFQDTSEIQFKIALLLADTPNICVVGDWKQSIYSFQYADVRNITEFEERLDGFTEELNGDETRVDIPLEDIENIDLTENYRSTQDVLDFSEHALSVPASSRESVDTEAIDDRIVSLSSNRDFRNTLIEAYQHDDEEELVLSKIADIVGNNAYAIEDDGEVRAPTFGDIAVLTRTRDFGRELLATAEEYDFPVAYEGGVELFRTDAAKRLLGWLRVLEDRERGWAFVLEDAGYTLDEIQHLLDTETYPTHMRAFAADLDSLESVSTIARRVFERYGHNGAVADAILTTVQSVYDATTMTRGDLIRFIETNIETGGTHEVSAPAGTDSVTVQTIHAAKGLEYPIVILANMNDYRFPPSGGGSGVITYNEEIGLRQCDVFDDNHARPHVYDNWRWDVLRYCLPDDADEERRLLYVAITRAEQHVLFTASDPNTFLEELPVTIEEATPDLQPHAPDDTGGERLSVTIPEPDGPVGYSPHSFMSEAVFEGVEDGRGTDFGSRVHEFAERYALGDDVRPANDDERAIVDLLDSLDGELRPEEDVHLPLDVDGRSVAITGIVDLLVDHPDGIDVIDFKTDRGRHAEAEYRKQLSVYYHVADAWADGRPVSASIFYTATGERQRIDPHSLDELVDLLRDRET